MISAKHLIGESIESFSKIILTESNGYELELEDSLIILTQSKLIYQVLVSQGKIAIYKLLNLNDLRLDGEFEEIIEIRLNEILSLTELRNNSKLQYITEVWVNSIDNGYLLMLGMFNDNYDYIVSLCFGSDEIILVSEINDFWHTLFNYKNHKLILRTNDYSTES